MRFGQDPPVERPVTCKLRHAASELGFELSCTPRTGALLAVLAASKPAGRLLELGNEAPKQVATHCGFADADTLRRAFARHVGVTPAEYRKRFARKAQ